MAEANIQAGGRDAGGGLMDPILVNDRFVIDPAKPLDELDSPTAMAYAADDRRDPRSDTFALVCHPGLPARVDMLAALRGLRVPGLLSVLDWDVVDWPPLGQRCLVALMGRPRGRRVADANGVVHGGRMNEYEMTKRVIDPLVRALDELSVLKLTHRAIRPDNLFYDGEGGQTVVLGESFSTPAGYDQSILFETPERAYADPAGRGVGKASDDVYALGVTLVFLLQGRNPVAHLSPSEFAKMRVEQGTYGALCGKARIPLSLIEPLRGMLNDDVESRWTLDALHQWLSGRRLAPVTQHGSRRSEIGFSFGGRDHTSLRTLSQALSRDVPEASRKIRDGGLEHWLRRTRNDSELADKVADTAQLATIFPNSAQGSDDVIVSKVCMLLHPQGPIRYKGLAFMPEAYGTLLAHEFLQDGGVQVLAEAVVRGLPAYWLEVQDGPVEDAMTLERTFTQSRSFMQVAEPGHGIERCLYELNLSLPCQSPLVVREYVTTIEDLLPAMDTVADRIDAKTRPMDRHICAFIAAHFPQSVDAHLAAIADPRQDQSNLGMLSLLALVQWRLKGEPLFGLTSWVGAHLAPVITTYHSRSLRTEIEREMPRYVRQGMLADLYDLIDNAERRRQDEFGYQQARLAFEAAEAEITGIEASDASGFDSGRTIGQQVSAALSMLIAFSAAMLMILMRMI